MQLKTLYPKLSTQEREALASKAGTSAAYLWQLSTRWQDKKPSIDLLSRLAAADKRLTVHEMVAEFAEPKVA